MATDKEIRINVDDSPLNKLRQQAENLARDMIRSSREFSTSSDEVIADLEEQIALMERRNRINEQYARSQIQMARREGQVTPQGAQQQFQAVGQQAQDNKIMVDLVREVIETLKQTSKDEIRSDREDVERRIRASRTVGELGPAGDPFQHLQETLQRQYLGTEEAEAQQANQERPNRGRGGSRRRRRVEQFFNRAAQAENEYTFLTSFLEVIPWVGKAASTVAARGINNAENFEKAAIAYGRLNRFGQTRDPLAIGREQGRLFGIDAARLGFTPGEALDLYTQVESTLKRDVTGGTLGNIAGAQRALGLDANAMQQLLSTARYDRSTADPSRVLAQFDKYLTESRKSLAILPELVGTFSNTATQILQTRGSVDTQSLAAVISNISRQTGFEGVRMDRLTGAFGQLGRTSNPVTRALLMRAFRETDPNLSFVDIQERLEGGLSEESRPGLQRFFEIMRERTGGGDALTLALQTALPQLGVKDIRDVIKSGGFSKALQKEQIAGPRDFEIEGEKFVGPIEKSSKQISGALELAGDRIVEVLDKIQDKLSEMLNNINNKENVETTETEAEKIVGKNTHELVNQGI